MLFGKLQCWPGQPKIRHILAYIGIWHRSHSQISATFFSCHTWPFHPWGFFHSGNGTTPWNQSMTPVPGLGLHPFKAGIWPGYWLVVWNMNFIFPFSWFKLGISSSQLTNSYFSEGLVYHQPGYNKKPSPSHQHFYRWYKHVCLPFPVIYGGKNGGWWLFYPLVN